MTWVRIPDALSYTYRLERGTEGKTYLHLITSLEKTWPKNTPGTGVPNMARQLIPVCPRVACPSSFMDLTDMPSLREKPSRHPIVLPFFRSFYQTNVSLAFGGPS